MDYKEFKEFKEFIDRVYRFHENHCNMYSDCSCCILNCDGGGCAFSDIRNMTEKQFEMLQKCDGIDWSKVPIDTKIYVWGEDSTHKFPRYFAGYTDGYVCAWIQGRTSFSIDNPDEFSMWPHAELCEPQEGEYNGNI